MTDQANSSGASPGRDAGPVRRIFRAMLAVGVIALSVKLVATAKELFVASRFGVGDALDAYLIAYMLPAFAVAVLGSAFQASLVPAWVQTREREGAEAANRLVENATSWSIAMLVVFTALLGAAFPMLEPVVASGFGPEKLALTRSLFYALLPIIVCGGVAGLWTSVLNAGERFVAPGLIPLATPVAVIAFLVVWPGSDPWMLVTGALAGAVVELVLLAVAMRRHGITSFPRWHGVDGPTRQVMRQYVPMVAGALLMSSTTVIDQSMAAMLGPGAVSALGYGNKLIGFAVGIASMAIGTAVLPSFSAMVARGEWAALRRTMRVYTLLIAGVTIPATVALAWLSEPIVRFLFERGAFTAGDTLLVGAVQRAFAWQIPFYLIGMLGVRLLSALEKNHVISAIAVTNVILNVVLNVLLSRILGVAGIALSTSIVYASSCTLVFASLAFLLRHRGSGNP